ncbi:hypothetical protein OESDEN_19855 [Oesophagostomum dentatum]|uniref:Uncharacterized protein n=1 Tax=Oesophagostomum dentatum TaxID=61180 RepID=A0A0B1SB54_OESDE|nr:hypothetical protein OESDEN_19855 [Oesophagostomum dentatum]
MVSSSYVLLAILASSSWALNPLPLPDWCSRMLCGSGYKCAMVEPYDCAGCDRVPRCYQENCNTSCTLWCKYNHRCVLVADYWYYSCPTPTCRRQWGEFTDGPPVEPDYTDIP